jgi:TRAP-type C4-dicarboxylate transport system permease small subunit
MTVLLWIKKVLDRLLETLVMVVVAVLVLDVLLQVFTRLASPLGRWMSAQNLGGAWKLLIWIIPAKPSAWTEELAIFMLIWVSLLGAAVALGRGAHLGIDYFVGKLPERIRLFTETFVFFCVAAFSFLVMVVGGIDLVWSTLELGQPSPALNVEMGYVYLAVPISGFFLTLYAVIGLIERCAQLWAGPDRNQSEIRPSHS